MRKFTFFLALMVAMVTTAFAAAPEDAVTVVKTEVALTTVAGQPGYVSSPHDHAVINPNSPWDKGGVAALIDGDVNTHFHTAWENVPAGPHYFQIDMGEGNTINKFCFDYVARNGGSDDYPLEFTIKGSNDDAEYELVTVVDLSSAKQSGARFSSAVLGGNKEYRYLRFEVTNTYVPNGSGYRIYFHAAEFDLYSVEEKVIVPEAEEIAARIAAANEALAFEGVGYPTAAPRAALQAAIDALNADGSSSNYAALQSAIDAYYATTDVVLPEAGKAYTITMVAKNGNKFYLNYTGSDVAMTARTSDELPESAVYVCEAGDNGAVAMKTNDGKYLAYHNKYAGLSWLQNNGNTKGFQDAKDELANITFAKIANGGNVAATNDKQLFGLLSWAGIRGIRTDNGNKENGYMVLKADGSDYDGASAPFFNDNYSSAFLLEEVEIAAPAEPVTFTAYTLNESMQVSDELTGTVEKVEYVAFACSDATATLVGTEDAVAYIYDKAKETPVAESTMFMCGDLGVGQDVAAMSFSAFTTPGTYVVYIPAGSFTINGVANEDIMSAEFTIPAPVVPETKVYEVESATPANGAEVEAIDEIVIKFTEDIALATDNMGNFIPVNLVDENNNVIELTVSDDANVWNKVVLTPATPITAAGTYTLDLSQLQLNGGECEGSYSWTVVEPLQPLTVVSVTPTEAVEKLETITVTFSDEIAGDFDPEDLMKEQIYLGNRSNGCSYEINGNVLTITPFYAITAAGEYALKIPAGVGITRVADGSAVTMSGEYTFTVEEPAAFEVVSYTPAEAVESLSTITVTFNEEIAGTYNIMSMDQIYLGSRSNGCSFEVNGNVLTITPFNAITTPGEYGLYIPAGVGITRKSNGEAVTMTGEIKFTVEAAPAEAPALEAAGYERNPLETSYDFTTGLLGKHLLSGVKINFGEVVKKYTTDLSGDYGQILDAEGNVVATLNKCMGANGTMNTFATPYTTTPITAAGTYKVVVKSGVILSADGSKEYKGGEFTFTVEKAAVEITPSAEDGFCYNETFSSVEEFNEWTITVKNAENDVVINNDVKATLKCGETVYEAAVTVEKDGNVQDIVLSFDGEFAEGRYTLDVPAGLFTVDGVENEAYAKSTFTYTLPQLEITRDFDSWESYLDQVWYMPQGAIITIANAESVEVDETKVATIAVGESVYSSTLNWYYDTWSKAYYLELTFEDFNADGFEFAKGDYTFTLPAGLYTVNGVANEEAVKTFTYGDPIIVEYTVSSISIENGATVESIDVFSLTFSNNSNPDVLFVSGNDQTYRFVRVSEIGHPLYGQFVCVNYDYEPISITEPGTYTLDLSQLEGLTGDKVFTWTIPAAAPTLNETVVFDFANNNWGIKTMAENNYSNLKVAADYTDGTNTIHIDPTANNGSYIYDNGFLKLGKTGTKIVLPAFDFAVEKIEVVGHSSGSSYPNVDMNVYVDGTAVSTACIGTTATSTFAIAADNQAAGNVYELVIGSNGGSSSYMHITYIKVYPAENKLEAPVIDLASGVYVGEQTVNVHSATTDIEGVTNVTYYYTLDGNEPTTEDEIAEGGEIVIEGSCTLKVIVELTLGENTYVSASTSAEYIITEEATYHRAVAVENGDYFLVADGKVAAPIEGTTLPAVEATVEGNDATAPVYYAITLEETAGGYYIKDVNGNYIYNTMMTPHKLASGTYAPMDAWTIEIADDENSTATIKCNGYVLALNKGVFCVVSLGGTDVPVMPTLYGVHATGINEAVVNGEAIESIYDITGRKIEKITKSGIYIVNGKKVLVK